MLKSSKKSILSFLLSAMMLFGLVPNAAMAQTDAHPEITEGIWEVPVTMENEDGTESKYTYMMGNGKYTVKVYKNKTLYEFELAPVMLENKSTAITYAMYYYDVNDAKAENPLKAQRSILSTSVTVSQDVGSYYSDVSFSRNARPEDRIPVDFQNARDNVLDRVYLVYHWDKAVQKKKIEKGTWKVPVKAYKDYTRVENSEYKAAFDGEITCKIVNGLATLEVKFKPETTIEEVIYKKDDGTTVTATKADKTFTFDTGKPIEEIYEIEVKDSAKQSNTPVHMALFWEQAAEMDPVPEYTSGKWIVPVKSVLNTKNSPSNMAPAFVKPVIVTIENGKITYEVEVSYFKLYGFLDVNINKIQYKDASGAYQPSVGSVPNETGINTKYTFTTDQGLVARLLLEASYNGMSGISSEDVILNLDWTKSQLYLPNGVYDVPVKLMHATKDEPSMGADAVYDHAIVKLEDGKTTYAIYLKGMYKDTLYGHLLDMKYYLKADEERTNPLDTAASDRYYDDDLDGGEQSEFAKTHTFTIEDGKEETIFVKITVDAMLPNEPDARLVFDWVNAVPTNFVKMNEVMTATDYSAELYFGEGTKEQAAKAYIAYYGQNGELVQVALQDVAVKQGQVNVKIPVQDKAYKTYKFMLWDNTNNPLF